MESTRTAAARSVNALMTAAYWEIGRRIVEFEQGGEGRAAYGEALIKRLGTDLSQRFGRGFGARNLAQMQAVYLAWPAEQILPALSPNTVDQIIDRRAHRVCGLVTGLIQNEGPDSCSYPGVRFRLSRGVARPVIDRKDQKTQHE